MQKTKRAKPRRKTWRDRITCDPELRGGEPCIRGTRIPVALVIGNLAVMSIAELLETFPQLKREDVEAAIYYASEAASQKRVA